MTQTRRIEGEIAFPGDTGAGVAAKIAVELRDVSLQDQASTVVAAATLEQVPVTPNCRVPFCLDAPASPRNSSLSLRVQVDMQAGRRSAAGDYLTTAAQPVPVTGDVGGLVVPVTRL